MTRKARRAAYRGADPVGRCVHDRDVCSLARMSGEGKRMRWEMVCRRFLCGPFMRRSVALARYLIFPLRKYKDGLCMPVIPGAHRQWRLPVLKL